MTFTTRRLRAVLITALALSACSPFPETEDAPGAPNHAEQVGTPAGETILAAAREVAATARYATLITLDADGHPQARIVDPFDLESDFTIWIGTNRRTRKVAEIARDPRVTLLYFDRDGASYLTLIGRAAAVDDSTMKAKYWKTEWAPFYPGGAQGDDYLLIRIQPIRLEVSAERLGIRNDPETWRPTIVAFP